MEYEDNLDFYLNLSRKELQGLCKKHNLPANRSHTQLAKSVASLFKMKNFRPAPSKEKSNSSAELSCVKSIVLDTKPKETANPWEDNTKGAYERTTNSSESDSHRVARCMKENGGDDRRYFLSQIKTSSHVDSQASKNACNTTAHAVCLDYECPEVFACTTTEARNEGLKPPVVADIQQIETGIQLGSKCHTCGTKDESQKSSQLINNGKEVLNHVITNSETHNLPIIPSMQPKVAECSTKGIFSSSEEISRTAVPSFQFFVTSEEGINLYVDLDSSPSEWISCLKDGVSTNLESQHHMSGTLANCTGILSKLGDHMKLSLENTGIDPQSNGVQGNSGCTTSTLSSVSENCQSEIYQPDATFASSESSVLISSSVPVEMSGCLGRSQTVSSFGVNHSLSHKQMAYDTSSCPEKGAKLFLDTSFRMEEGNASVFDIARKPFDNMEVLSTKKMRHAEETGCDTLKTDKYDSNNVEAGNLGNSLTNISEENILLKSDETEKIIVTSDTGDLENDSDAHQIPTERGSMQGSLEVAGQHNTSASACEVCLQQGVDCLVTEALSDTGSADDLQNHPACILENCSEKDPPSALDDELDKSITVKEKDSSECSQLLKSSDRSSKRSRSPEFHEEIQSKRHHSNVENKNGIMVNLRSARTSAKEISERAGQPRRSARLLSK